MQVTHQKTDNTTNWTQADLNVAIASGRFAPGTLLVDIVLPQDWNAGHTLSPTGRIITAAGAVTMVAADDIVEVAKTVAAPTTVNLPTAPVNYKVYIVKDGAGVALNNNLTVVPPSGTIDGNANFVMATNWESESFYFNGTNWRMV